MSSNDNLLCHIVTTDEMNQELIPKYKTDDIIYNPKKINVPANEVVYIHFFHCNDIDFDIKIITPTTILKLTPNNTLNGSNNTIIKALGTINITTTNTSNFFVQLLRIYY